MKTFLLELRTPSELVLSQNVFALQAEDPSGWFGIYPGRRELIAALVPALLIYRDAQGEGFVALDGGLLRFHGDVCRVTSREAVATRQIAMLAEHLRARSARRKASRARQADAVDDLVQDALTRLVREAR